MALWVHVCIIALGVLPIEVNMNDIQSGILKCPPIEADDDLKIPPPLPPKMVELIDDLSPEVPPIPPKITTELDIIPV